MAFLDSRYLLENETAFVLYNEVADLPVVDVHNHADVAQIADNVKFSDPWALFAATDHYVWEVMRKRGVEEKFITGDASPKEKWMELSRVFPELVGNPVYEWIHLDLRTIGINDILLGPDTGEDVWEQAKAVLAVSSNYPQRLLERMKIETMCSTDDPADTLEHHAALNKAMGRKIVRPTWRPDKAVNLLSPGWREYIARLEKRFDRKISGVEDLLKTLKISHDFFGEQGAVASDHALLYPLSGDATLEEAQKAFLKALDGKTPPSREEADQYASYLLREFAAMNEEKGWVFQMHIGARRDVRAELFRELGPDSGGDVSDHAIDIVRPLSGFLNHFDNRLKVVLYCLDPGHQASLASVARAFGSKVRLGSAWWLNDTPVGMRRQLEYIGSVDLLYNFAGMVSDSRKLLSYSSRFDMFRRVLADTVARMVNAGQFPLSLGMHLMKHVCYTGPKEFFRI